MSKQRKISLIGAGNIGGELAAQIARTALASEVVLFDIPVKEDFAKGKALDLEQNGAINCHDCRIIGSSDWADCADSGVLIVTAGIPRLIGPDASSLPAAEPAPRQQFGPDPQALAAGIAQPAPMLRFASTGSP